MEIAWTEKAEKDLARLGDQRLIKRIVGTVERFAETGHGDVKKLTDESGYRLRVGDWRVRFEYEDGTVRVMVVMRVLKRARAYR